MISDPVALEKLSAALEVGIHLRDYVHKITLVESSDYTTSSVVSLFSVALQRKLPGLQELGLTSNSDYSPYSGNAGPRPSSCGPTTTRQQICIPLHPRFPVFLSTFTIVSRLHISHVTFQRFSGFARMVQSLPALQHLACSNVRWTIFGLLPLSMRPQTEETRTFLQPFAPRLRILNIVSTP